MLKFHVTCTDSSADLIGPMVDTAIEVSRRTFLKHVDRSSLSLVEMALGYADHPGHGLTMAGDFHVAYYRSKFCGYRCYYFVWSAIEHVFVNLPEVEDV